MTAPRRTGSGLGLTDAQEGGLVGGVVAIIAVAAVSIWGSVLLASRFSHGRRPPGNVAKTAVEVVDGRFPLTGAAVGWLVALLVAVAVVALAVTVVLLRRSARTPSIDRSARRLIRDRALADYTGGYKGGPHVYTGAPGLLVGRVVGHGGLQLRSPWEYLLVAIGGTRAGKSTCLAVPAIVEAPGGVIATTNKRDIVDASRALREAKGRCWVFDAEKVLSSAGAQWWWDPLAYVVDVATARKLAKLLSFAARDRNAATSDYWAPRAEELLAGLLLAAAVSRRGIAQVYRWLADPNEEEPAELIRNRYELVAAGLDEARNQPERQRGGVYGHAALAVAFLADPEVLAWLTPAPGRDRFDPDRFVASTDTGRPETLYLLSSEHGGGTVPLVTALTAIVFEAAEARARRCPGGTLPVPLVSVLDEVANICRIERLASMYAYYGSMGIILWSLLQSWAQGEETWGPKGMERLWNAANIQMFFGGAERKEFLEPISERFGEYDRATRSRSHGPGQVTNTYATQRHRIFGVDELAAMPRGRAVAMLARTRPVLVETLHWSQRPEAKAIADSFARADAGLVHTSTAGPDTDSTYRKHYRGGGD